MSLGVRTQSSPPGTLEWTFEGTLRSGAVAIDQSLPVGPLPSKPGAQRAAKLKHWNLAIPSREPFSVTRSKKSFLKASSSQFNLGFLAVFSHPGLHSNAQALRHGRDPCPTRAGNGWGDNTAGVFDPRPGWKFFLSARCWKYRAVFVVEVVRFHYFSPFFFSCWLFGLLFVCSMVPGRAWENAGWRTQDLRKGRVPRVSFGVDVDGSLAKPVA